MGLDKEEFNELKKNLDAFFIFTMAIMVFFMQAGFALLEAGAVRYMLHKETTLFKKLF